MSTKPRHRYLLEISISGDDWEDVLKEARFILPHVEEHGPNCHSFSTGATSDHFVDVNVDPSMTPARYKEITKGFYGARCSCGATTTELMETGHRKGCRLRAAP